MIPFRVFCKEEATRTGKQFLELANAMLAAGESALIVFVYLITTPRSLFLVITAHLEFVWPDPDGHSMVIINSLFTAVLTRVHEHVYCIIIRVCGHNHRFGNLNGTPLFGILLNRVLSRNMMRPFFTASGSLSSLSIMLQLASAR